MSADRLTNTIDTTAVSIDTSTARVVEICNGLASLAISHPHFATPLKAMDLIHALTTEMQLETRRKEELRAFVRRIAGTYSLDRDEFIKQQKDAVALLEQVP